MAKNSCEYSVGNNNGRKYNLLGRFRFWLTLCKQLFLGVVGTRFFSSPSIVKSNSSFLEKVESMPIPDEAWFCTTIDNEVIRFSDLRSLLKSGNSARLREILKDRLDNILIAPSKRLNDSKHAFALMILTCTGIESLGSIFYPSNVHSEPFREVCGKMHQVLPRKLTKKFKESLSARWSNNEEIDKITHYSYLIYRYMRNELSHNLVSKGVYLSYEETDTIIFNQDEGYLIVNPRWFWLKFEQLYQKLLTSNDRETQMIRYFESIVK
jgi:hypothetical protein